MTNLFDPISIGDYPLKNRILMAPLSRGRADGEGIPNELMAEYYAQRASAGLIITEATAVSRQGRGWLNSPGLYSEAQTTGWRKVAKAVHTQQGRIFAQIWHMGSTVHPDFVGGATPVSSSAVRLEGALPTPKGRDREFVTPRAMTLDEIQHTVNDFVTAAKNALDAGLDGVEIHAAQGFLIDQFIRDGVNQRTDSYGGSTDNRLRFLLEVVEAACRAIGPGKVGVRLSPSNKIWGIKDSNPGQTFGRAVERLNDCALAYLHILEPKPDATDTIDYLTPMLREKYQGTLFSNGGYSRMSGEAAVAEGRADAIVYGTPFIANPDLVERFRLDAPISEPERETFYTPGREGYTDYPVARKTRLSRAEDSSPNGE